MSQIFDPSRGLWKVTDPGEDDIFTKWAKEHLWYMVLSVVVILIAAVLIANKAVELTSLLLVGIIATASVCTLGRMHVDYGLTLLAAFALVGVVATSNSGIRLDGILSSITGESFVYVVLFLMMVPYGRAVGKDLDVAWAWFESFIFYLPIFIIVYTLNRVQLGNKGTRFIRDLIYSDAGFISILPMLMVIIAAVYHGL